MTLEVRKKENESSLSLLRRFSQRVKQSGNLARVRGLRFKNRPKSKLKKKEDALKRIASQKKIEFLRKMGEIK